jgi:hypothetical protein
MNAVQFGTFIVMEPLTVWLAAVVVVAGAVVVGWPVGVHVGRSGFVPDGSHLGIVGAAVVVVCTVVDIVEVCTVVVVVVVCTVVGVVVVCTVVDVVLVCTVVDVVVVFAWAAEVAVELQGGRSGLLPEGSQVAARESVLSTSAITAFNKSAIMLQFAAIC